MIGLTGQDLLNMNILNLPDEILRIIFNKLNTIDKFSSLIDVNQRFDRLALDSLDNHHLNFVHERFAAQNSSILDNIYSKILPQINDKITKLTLDPFSVERIPNTIQYPQLHSLSLINYQIDQFAKHLDDGLIPYLRNQITNLSLSIIDDKDAISYNYQIVMFMNILFSSQSLTNFTFSQPFSSTYLTCLSLPKGFYLSTILTHLNIKVNTFDDCLNVVNGYFQSLSTLIIRITIIGSVPSNINNEKKLGNLKCFSLVGERFTDNFNRSIVPLLRRLLNLEQLSLQLSIRATESYIDGNHLYEQVLKYLPKLNEFMFNIHSHLIKTNTRVDLPTNDDIRKSFVKHGISSVGICTDKRFVSDCHVYSLPYQFKDFLFMTNCFQSSSRDYKFNNVRILMMCDRYPFEQKLFKIISEDFPFLEKLILLNLQEQINDQQQNSSTLITFNHLFKLNLIDAHQDYVQQFLCQTMTSLPCLTTLKIRYQTLVDVTNNFTNDDMHFNCAKIKCLDIDELIVHPENFHSFFPSLCNFY